MNRQRAAGGAGRILAMTVTACAAACAASAPKNGEPEGGAPPAYRGLRYDEDYSYLADPSKRRDFWDPIKYIRLNEEGDRYLSLGGEGRWRYEYYRNYRWDPDSPFDGGYLLQRYLLHADLHLGPSVRLFGQLQASLEHGREGGPRPTDEDRLDVHQLFADARLRSDAERELVLRVGRQEMAYGSYRLISTRDGPNIRRAFDAARLLTRFGAWTADGFLSKPVEEEPGTFDDGRSAETFWGLYATKPLRGLRGSSVDLHYLGLDRPDATFVQATADEQRQSLGSRFFGNAGPWDWNLEGVYQFGRFGGNGIRAWTLATDTGYTFRDVRFTPRLGLRADVISGDGSAADGTLGTFNPLFPRGSYFGEIALIGPQNIIDLHPTLDLHLAESLTLTLDWDFFWRYSTGDGIYDNGGNVIRGADGGARFIGSQASVGIEWEVRRHTTLEVVYSHFFAGDYLRESGPGADVDFLAAWLTYRF
jgi:hypothetical protein